MDTSDTTRRALDRIATEPDEGWAELVPRMESQLRVLLHFRMSAAARAHRDEEDVIQEVFSEMARHLDRFEYRGKGSLRRWLAGILRHRLFDLERGRTRQPVPESSLVRPRDASRGRLFDAVESSRNGASRGARRRELEERVKKVLADLPDDLREVLLARVYEGCSGVEIAERLGIAETTVSARFKRALSACAPELLDLAP